MRLIDIVLPSLRSLVMIVYNSLSWFRMWASLAFASQWDLRGLLEFRSVAFLTRCYIYHARVSVARNRLPWFGWTFFACRYGWDSDGGGVHDVIGTRCDPYTNKMLSGVDYHYCCHSNLTRALCKHKDCIPEEVEHLVHDVLNVFMCTGFTR